jgi:hypothetical protein
MNRKLKELMSMDERSIAVGVERVELLRNEICRLQRIEKRLRARLAMKRELERMPQFAKRLRETAVNLGSKEKVK